MSATALSTLFEQHHLGVFRFLMRMTGSRSDAEELTQEVFLRAARQLRRSGDGPVAAPWLYTVARNLVIDRNRRRATRPEPLPLDLAAPQPRRAPQHQVIALREALGALPEEERAAFLLRESGGLGYEQIAAIEGATPGAIRNRIYRARQALRKLLAASRPARGIRKESI